MVNAQEWLENLINWDSETQEIVIVNTKEKRAEAKELFIMEQLEGVLDLVDFTNLVHIYISHQVDAKQFEMINKPAETEIILNSWIDINLRFAKKDNNSGKTYQQQWEEKGSNYEEVKEWFNAWGGFFAVNGYNLYSWLRDEKKVDSVWVLNNIDHDNKLESFKKCSEEYKEYSINKDHGLCPEPECNKFNTSIEWCQTCNAKHFKEDFENWTSGNSDMDEIIQNSQSSATSALGVLEWVPYEQFTDIKYLAQGGFGIVYKAEREKGVIDKWNIDEKKWERGRNNKFALKVLEGSQNVTKDFLQEINNYQAVTQKQTSVIVPCFGISQEPATGNYVMVMLYMNKNDLRKFLRNHSNELEFRDKIKQLAIIATTLNVIHSQNLVHKDFHPGNILIRKFGSDESFIPSVADLGLSRPANETNQGKIYGVLPYVAPEVLRGEKYTSAADIYSFSMVIYEMVSELFPYYDLAHDNDLAQKICQGLRPNLDEIIAPPLLKDLIKKCWDADPLTRPTAWELVLTLEFWSNGEVEIEKYNEFTHQVQEAEELGKTLSSQANKRVWKVHPQAIHTSWLLDFPNLPQPHNNPSREWQTSTLLELQIKGVEKELEIIKESLDNELAKLLDQFIEIKKESLKNKEDKQVKKQAREVKKQLEEKSLSEEKIDEVIRYCEKLVELEQQSGQEKLSSQLIKINDKIKETQKQIGVLQETLGEELIELVKRFIKVNKELIRNENDKKLREEVKNLHQLLRSKGFSKEKMEKIVEYCENLIDLEWQAKQWNKVNDKANLGELQEYIQIPLKFN